MVAIESFDTVTIDEQIANLQAHKHEWAKLAIRKKRDYAIHILNKTNEIAERWVTAAARAKGLPADSPLMGEEWVSGPWAMIQYLSQIEKTLASLAKGEIRMPPGTRTRPDGQLIAEMFPLKLLDQLILSGTRAEVWMQPGVTKSNLRDNMASFYRQQMPEGRVSLVLGAGNISSIAPLDVLYKLYTEGEVCLLKMNPVNDYLGEFFEEIFAPMVEAGYVAFTYGGGDVGAYLTAHEDIESIHITGAARTHDIIVFGPGEEGQKRKERNEPILDKPISSELGAVSPVIVVPGPWSEADMQFQAENITTMKFHNGGFNCIAAQTVIVSEDWPLKDRFMAILEDTMKSVAARMPYYPGADARCRHVLEAHPDAVLIDPADSDAPRLLLKNLSPEGDMAFEEEFFAGVLAHTELPGKSAAQFLRNAVDFANDKLWGTLGANVILHPTTVKELGSQLEDFVADLRYGAVGVNMWSAAAYMISQCTWGGFPGYTLDNIQSGQGVVHNTFLFDKPQKSVVYGPFTPYPRNLLRGEWHVAFKPAWFVTNKEAKAIGEMFTRYEASPGYHHLPGLLIASMQG